MRGLATAVGGMMMTKCEGVCGTWDLCGFTRGATRRRPCSYSLLAPSSFQTYVRRFSQRGLGSGF